VEILGKLLNLDLNMSPFRNEACGFCHMPYVAFSGPIPSVNLTMIGYPGTLHYRTGKRTAQRYTYSPDFPVLEYEAAVPTAAYSRSPFVAAPAGDAATAALAGRSEASTRYASAGPSHTNGSCACRTRQPL
jgi:cytochrome c peroxidase